MVSVGGSKFQKGRGCQRRNKSKMSRIMQNRKSLLDTKKRIEHKIAGLKERIAALKSAGKPDDRHPRADGTNREVLSGVLRNLEKKLARTNDGLSNFYE